MFFCQFFLAPVCFLLCYTDLYFRFQLFSDEKHSYGSRIFNERKAKANKRNSKIQVKFENNASKLASIKTTQQSVHPTLGILARFQAFFYASAFFQLDSVPPPAPARVTPAVRLFADKIVKGIFSEIKIQS